MSVPKLTRTQTETACQEAMKRYIDIWNQDEDDNHMWQKCNQVISVFQFAETCTQEFGSSAYDYYQLVKGSDNAFLQDFHKYVTNAVDNQSLWTDDFGWGGLASLTVAKWLMKNITQADPSWQDYANLACSCWKEFLLVSTNREAVYNTTPVPGGTSNRPYMPEVLDETKYWKNTVSNSLYFYLSMALYDFLNKNPSFVPNDRSITKTTCLQSAYSQYVYFSAWFATPTNGSSIPDNYWHNLTINGTKSPSAMIEERPVAYTPPYKGYDPSNTDVAWTPQALWTGDQGIFVAASALLWIYAPQLAGLPPINPPPDPNRVRLNLNSWTFNMWNGVQTALTYPSFRFPGQGDDILREGPFYNLFFGDAPDYVCGRSVLARFFTTDETLTFWRATGNSTIPLKNSLTATAHSIATKAIPEKIGYQLVSEWASPAKNELAYSIFNQVWGAGSSYSWSDEDTAVWRNYCQMMGFDLYQAYIKTQPWSKGKAKGKAKGEDEKSNGHTHETNGHKHKE